MNRKLQHKNYFSIFIYRSNTLFNCHRLAPTEHISCTKKRNRKRLKRATVYVDL